jgi:hypothetical protein
VRLLVAVGLVATIAFAACTAPAPPPTPVPTSVPTAAPTPTFRPAVPPTSPPVSKPQAQPTVDTSGNDPVEVQAAFLSNVDDIIAEATDLSVAPCEDLVAVTKANPSLVPNVRGFAAAIKRVSTSQPVLDTDEVKAAIADLDKIMGQLDGALSLCGITQR